jgi:protein-S-isoprenylcysteine O-methyltransferase
MAAIGLTLVEYFIESLLFPGMKGYWLFVIVGFLVALTGQAIRSLAMYTAGRNFTHMIAEEKKDTHKLVTVGIYQYVLSLTAD